MKLVGIVLILLSGFLYVVNLFRFSTKRIAVLKRFISDAEVMKNEIVFKKTPVAEVFEILSADGINSDFYKETVSALKEGECLENAFERGCSVICDFTMKEDREILYSFFRLLGATDADGHKSAFDSFENRLSDALSEAGKFKKEELKPKCALISFAFITAVILII